jgi:phage host-nuclease inhibitor protein Gam
MKIATIKPMTATDAAAKLDRYATLFVDVQKRNAKTAKAVAKLQEAAAAEVAPSLTEMKEIELALATFARENQVLFEKKRKIKTALAALGLQLTSEILIADPEALIAWAKKRAFDDLYKVTETCVKSACKKRLDAGEKLPGVSKDEHENINITVAKHLLAEVEASAE